MLVIFVGLAAAWCTIWDAMDLRFSVVIATHGRPEVLLRSIESFRAQSFPPENFEIIVVDDGSPEPVAPLLDRLQGHLCLRVIRQSNQGPAAARNQGLKEARGAYIAFTDDDCCPDPQWLTELSSAFSRHPSAAVGGLTVNSLGKNRYASASQMLIDFLYGYYAGRSAGHAFFTSNNLAFPAGALRGLGGFDTRFRLAAGEHRECRKYWLMAVSSFFSTLLRNEMVTGSPEMEACGAGPGATPPPATAPGGFLPAFPRLFPGIVRNSFSRRSAHKRHRRRSRRRRWRRRCAVRSAYCRRRRSSKQSG